MANLLNFFLRRAKFYSFEFRVIEEVISRLDESGTSQLRRQVNAINKIQRLTDGKEVNLYQMRHGKLVFDDALRFPGRASEALMASVSLHRQEQRTNLKVELWVAKGRLFSLVFNQPPKKYFAGEDLMAVQPEIASVKIWFDPMSPQPVSSDQSIDESVLTGWLRKWHIERKLTNLRAPLSLFDRSAYLERLDAQLPPEYLELIAKTEGAKLGACEIHGASGVREIVCSEANYYVMVTSKNLCRVRDEVGKILIPT